MIQQLLEHLKLNDLLRSLNTTLSLLETSIQSAVDVVVEIESFREALKNCLNMVNESRGEFVKVPDCNIIPICVNLKVGL